MVIAHGPTNANSLGAMAQALAGFEIENLETNILLLLRILNNDHFRHRDDHTDLADLST